MYIKFIVSACKKQQVQNKKPLKTVWPDCKVATKFEKID